MIIKDPKKLAQRMMLLCILIGIVALAMGIMAVSMQRYGIAILAVLVVIVQIWNYKIWQKKTK